MKSLRPIFYMSLIKLGFPEKLKEILLNKNIIKFGVNILSKFAPSCFSHCRDQANIH